MWDPLGLVRRKQFGGHGPFFVWARYVSQPHTSVPAELVAGDSWWFDLTYSSFPSPEYTLSLAFRGAKDLVTEPSQVLPSDGGFQVRIPGSKTNLPEGEYAFYATVTKDSDRWTVQTGRLFVRANPASSVNAKSDDEQELEILREQIRLREQEDAASYQMDGRAVNKELLKDLYQREAVLMSRIEAARNGGQLIRPIRMTLAPAR